MKTLFLGALLVASLSPTAIAADPKPLAKVVIALKPDKNPDQMMQERQSLSAFLAAKIGNPVEVIVPLSSAVILEGFANGTVDLGYLSATDLLNARKASAAELLLAGEIDGKNSYRSYWLALKEKPYTSVAELKGKPIAFASKTSTSGYVIPMWDLKEKGLLSEPKAEAFFGAGNVFYGTGYVSAVERVLNGQAEAAAVSYYVFDKDKHLTVEQRSRLKKIAEQGPVPTHVIAARSSLAPADRAALKAALESLNEPEHQALRDNLFTSKLISVDPEQHTAALKGAIEFLSQRN